MADQQPQPGVEQSASDRILASIDPIVNATASQLGNPPASAKYTTEQQVQMATTSPYRDPQTAMQAIVDQGLAAGKKPAELVDEVMDTVYPDFRKLIETGRPSLEDRKAYGNWLGREIEKRGGWGVAGAVDPMLPEPDAAPPLPEPEPMGEESMP